MLNNFKDFYILSIISHKPVIVTLFDYLDHYSLLALMNSFVEYKRVVNWYLESKIDKSDTTLNLIAEHKFLYLENIELNHDHIHQACQYKCKPIIDYFLKQADIKKLCQFRIDWGLCRRTQRFSRSDD